jgi:hypothetical protein
LEEPKQSKNLKWPGAIYTVTHTCNPSYSGGRDQEDHSSNPALANSSQDSVSKKKFSQKKAGGVAQGVDPEFKSQYHKKKKKAKWIKPNCKKLKL